MRLNIVSMEGLKALRIGYVPEHYSLPLHLAKPHFPFEVELIPFPSGTGHMISSLRSKSIDLGIGLTEGWVAGLLTSQGREERGYQIVGSWVQTPLRWAVVTGRNRDEIQNLADLETHRRVGISRQGSGSHVMAFVLARQQGWFAHSATPETKSAMVNITLGPFANLRDGVVAKDGIPVAADFFMWEHFTTKPYFSGEGAPLKKIGEIYTPWPSWHIAASSTTFPDPHKDGRLAQMFQALDRGVKHFNTHPDEAIRLLGTGELAGRYSEEDAREWLQSVEFAQSTAGVERALVGHVIEILQGAGVIDKMVPTTDGDWVIGIERKHEEK